jgi:hypothetical protein
MSAITRLTAAVSFCPALTVISDTLKLSHNVAGVTFLALGNGAPDIFSVYSSINNVDNGARLALGELFGKRPPDVVKHAPFISISLSLTLRNRCGDVCLHRGGGLRSLLCPLYRHTATVLTRRYHLPHLCHLGMLLACMEHRAMMAVLDLCGATTRTHYNCRSCW